MAGLADGDIDCVVSDHSPCTPELKRPDTGDFAAAWGGIASLQLGLPLVWTAAAAGHTLADVVRWMARRPADLVGLPRKGRIEVGADADLVAFDPDAAFTVDAGPAAPPATRSRRTPADRCAAWSAAPGCAAVGRRRRAAGRLLSRERRDAEDTDRPAADQPGTDFRQLPDLASRLLGGGVVPPTTSSSPRATTWSSRAPVHTPHTFGHKGQVYDGWETRRRREPGHDWAIVRLGAPGLVHGVVVDTAFFTGNYPP